MTVNRRAVAIDAIASFSENGLGHYIDGVSVPGRGEPFEVIDPTSGGRIGRARDATAGEVDQAVAAAAKAFPAWAKTSGEERKRLLHKIADLIIARANQI